MKNRTISYLIIAILIIFTYVNVAAQKTPGVSINLTGANAHPSAFVDISSTTQGVLIPRMTSTQRAAISSPATGLMVYETDPCNCFYYYNAGWVKIGSGTSAGNWGLTGNAGITSSTNFIGTTDTAEVKIKSNGVTGIKIDSSGRVSLPMVTGMGTLVSGVDTIFTNKITANSMVFVCYKNAIQAGLWQIYEESSTRSPGNYFIVKGDDYNYIYLILEP